ncbi:MAG: PAS domain S-box protein [Campylobacterota bacterium]|nr:PAS domain S-box protein [Campylobacterota bacterium]
MIQNDLLSQITLLYVEDEKAIRDEMVEILDDTFKKIYVSSDGLKGLELFKEHSIDVVLTDIRMPNMDGIEMSKEIRKIDSDVPIIVSSAFNDSNYLIEAIKAGVHNYLVKPINIKDLFKILDRLAKNIVSQKELFKSNQLLNQYRIIVDETSIVSKSDLKGNITFVNSAFEKISGYTKDELIGKPHNILRHPDMEASTFEELWKTIRQKKEWRGVVKNRAKDGTVYIVESTIVPILDENGEIVEYISIRNDITKKEEYRELIESNLRSSSNSLKEKITFIDEYEKALKSGTLFCRTTLDGKITTTSELFCKLMGYGHNKLMNVDYKTILIDKNVYMNVLKNYSGDGKVWQGVLLHKSADNKTIYLEASIIPIFNHSYEIVELLHFFVDVTEMEVLNKEIVNTQREVISTMGAIGETRSKETGLHVKRVAEYSKFLAIKAGLSEEEAENLKMASPMHDIGKVGIPDSILNKPGKLTDEEFEIMKTHATLGYEMLKNSSQPLLKTSAIVANEHHEKYNGRGYPRGLAGEDIHIYGRITAIADVFDALGHDRVYKKAWELDDILELFKKERGHHFDPRLIDIFFDNLDEILSIKKIFDGEGDFFEH